MSIDARHILLFGETTAGRYAAFGPPVFVRFALPFIRGREYLIPAKVVDDRGREFLAPEVFDWMEARGDAFPRADVFGLTPEGQPRQCFMKELDLASRPLAFTSRAPDDFPGLALSFAFNVEAALSGDTPQLWADHPPLLRRAVPCYAINSAQFGERLPNVVMELIGDGTEF